MRLLNNKLAEKIDDNILKTIVLKKYELALENISDILDELYANIPENKRISYGKVYTIKILSNYLYSKFIEMNIPVLKIGSMLFQKSKQFKNKAVALAILSSYGVDNNYEEALIYFESAARSNDWELRECAAMFFRRIIKKYPQEMKGYLSNIVKSRDPNIRRFVSETLRPVNENKWFYKYPQYPLSILENLFTESSPYPRTSVGNNLSDLARQQKKLIYKVIKKLVRSKNPDSYWIAYRACRNLVKQDPLKVMNMLNCNEYKYKQRLYKTSDYQGY